jgi:hypothetical protein
MTARGWTEAQKRAYVIADNKLALNAGWDEDLLRVELSDLQAGGFDLGLAGFEATELEALLAEANSGLTDPDDATDVQPREVSALGDVWLLGRHRVMVGDGTSQTDIERLVAGVVPDLANCDPPYGISVVKAGKVGGGKPHPFKGSVGGAKPFGRVHGPAKNAIIQPGMYAPIIGDETTDTAVASYHALVALGVPAIVLWGGNYFANALPPSRCWLVWDKENTGSFADAELAWTNQDAVVRLLRHQWSGLIKASERGECRVHPTQKPAALADWVIETVSPNAKTVIDLFLGSGATLISAERKRLTFFGMEMAPAYVDVAVRRWQAFTGDDAMLEGDGRTFTQLEEARLSAAA